MHAFSVAVSFLLSDGIASIIRGIGFLSQVEAADNQLKSVRRFLDEQAVEREQEREEYGKEIQCLVDALKGKDKNGTPEHDLHLEVTFRMEKLHAVAFTFTLLHSHSHFL